MKATWELVNLELHYCWFGIKNKNKQTKNHFICFLTKGQLDEESKTFCIAQVPAQVVIKTTLKL